MATTPASIALSKDLKRRGFTFVGPTTVYAFMQAMGLVNDHLHDCPTRAAAEAARRAFRVPARRGGGRLTAPATVADRRAVVATRYTRRLYSPVRVSISILSPVVTNSGTGTSKPLAIFAGFSTLPDVSPLTAGSVYVTSRTTVFGSSTEIARPS